MRLKEMLVLAIYVSLSLPLALSLSIQMNNSYEQGETIIAKVVGNVIDPIQQTQVRFMRDGHVEVPFEYEAVKVGEYWYIWVEGKLNVDENYTLVLEDITTTVDGAVKKIDYYQNFTIGGNKTEYGITPGAIATREDFEIKATLYKDEDQIITIDYPSAREVRLKPGENIISFPFANVNGIKTYMVKFGRYYVPLQITGNGTWVNPPRDVSVEPQRISRVFREGESVPYFQIKISTNSKKDIENVSFRYNSGIINIDPKISKIPYKTGSYINITFRERLSEDIEETIYIDMGNFSISIPVDLTFIENKTVNITNLTNQTSPLWYCLELEGMSCLSDEYCDGEIMEARDGACCVGECKPAKNEGGSSKWIGFVIAGLVIIAGVIIYMQYKKTKSNPNQLDKKIEEAERSSNTP